ncbi:MAG TPA: hypothetical protein PLS70_20445 [Acidobacteriota bacterium]|nr:hypothetical protein [Acidobacteriota bacterium]
MRHLFLASLVLTPGLLFTFSLASWFEPRIALATTTLPEVLVRVPALRSQLADFLYSSHIIPNPATLSEAQPSTAVTLTEDPNTVTLLAIQECGEVGTATSTVTLDTTAPVLTITSPPDGAITTQTQITVVGTVTHTSPVTVLINGQLARLSGNRFTALVSLVEGINILTLVAVDSDHHATSLTRQVIRDSTPPTIVIAAPEDGKATSEAQILVTGEIADATSTLVRVNNQFAPLTGTTFHITVPLTEGVNPLSIVAIDGAQNTTTKVLQIERDSKEPALHVTSPVETIFVTEAAQVTFRGTVTDVTTTTVYVNSEIAPLNGTTFELTFPLREGRNKITVGAVDEAENISAMTFTITRQTIIPLTLTVKFPIDGDITRSPEIMIVGDVTGTGTVQVTANGIPIRVTPYGEVISKQFEISEGNNSLHLVAVDALHNRVEVVRTVFKDSVPPVISDLSPPNRAIITTPTITLEGNVADATGVTVEVNEVEVPVSEGHFIATNIPIAEGENIFWITATDEAGNSVSEVIRLTGKDQPRPTQPVFDQNAPHSEYQRAHFLKSHFTILNGTSGRKDNED